MNARPLLIYYKGIYRTINYLKWDNALVVYKLINEPLIYYVVQFICLKLLRVCHKKTKTNND